MCIAGNLYRVLRRTIKQLIRTNWPLVGTVNQTRIINVSAIFITCVGDCRNALDIAVFVENVEHPCSQV